jgi:uncharacterized protein with PQ loop repeat
MGLDTVFTILGYVGSCLLATMQTPQIYHTIKQKKIKDLSIYSVLLNMLASSCMFSYSYYFKLYPISIASGCVIICDGILVILYKTYHVYNVKNPHLEGWEIDNRPPCTSPRNNTIPI